GARAGARERRRAPRGARATECGYSRRLPYHDDGRVVSTPSEVPIEHPRRQRRMAPGEPGIAADVPARRQAVRVQHDERALRPRVRELVDLPDLVPEDAVVRHHAPRGAVDEDRPGDVADPGEPDEPSLAIELRDGGRRPPRAAEARVDALQDLGRRSRTVSAERRDRGVRRRGRTGPMPEAVDHERGPARPLDDGPVVAADGLAGDRYGDGADV